MRWLFDQGPDVAAMACRSVMDGQPVLLVTHYLDDHSWGFLDGQPWKASEAVVVSMGSVIAAHPDLHELADLEVGWSATRTSPGSDWVRSVDPLEDGE